MSKDPIAKAIREEAGAHNRALFSNEADETARRERREWRKQREEYAAMYSAMAVGDQSAYEDGLRAYDEEYGAGPIAPAVTRDSSGKASTTDSGQFEPKSIEFLHMLVGGEISADGMEVLAPGPGHSFMDRSMSVRPANNPYGYVLHSFSTRTPAAECIKYVNFLIDRWIHEHSKNDEEENISAPSLTNVPESWVRQSSSLVESREDRDARRIAQAKREWNIFANPTLGDSVYEYLCSRALEIPENLIGRVVRYQRNGRWYESNGDQTDRNGRPYSVSELMMFACRDVLTNEGRAVQILRLPHIGKGPSRKVHGIVKNTAIKLTPHEDILAAGELAVAEGFESALAAMMLGYRNVWACINSGNIETLPVIDGVRKLTILAENCPENKHAREICALRWFEAGREVVVAMPNSGKDFNDDLVALLLSKAGGVNG